MKAVIEALNEATQTLSRLIGLQRERIPPSAYLKNHEKLLLDDAQSLLLHTWECLKDYQKEEPSLCDQVNASFKL